LNPAVGENSQTCRGNSLALPQNSYIAKLRQARGDQLLEFPAAIILGRIVGNELPQRGKLPLQLALGLVVGFQVNFFARDQIAALPRFRVRDQGLDLVQRGNHLMGVGYQRVVLPQLHHYDVRGNPDQAQRRQRHPEAEPYISFQGPEQLVREFRRGPPPLPFPPFYGHRLLLLAAARRTPFPPAMRCEHSRAAREGRKRTGSPSVRTGNFVNRQGRGKDKQRGVSKLFPP